MAADTLMHDIQQAPRKTLTPSSSQPVARFPPLHVLLSLHGHERWRRRRRFPAMFESSLAPQTTETWLNAAPKSRIPNSSAVCQATVRPARCGMMLNQLVPYMIAITTAIYSFHIAANATKAEGTSPIGAIALDNTSPMRFWRVVRIGPATRVSQSRVEQHFQAVCGCRYCRYRLKSPSCRRRTGADGGRHSRQPRLQSSGP